MHFERKIYRNLFLDSKGHVLPCFQNVRVTLGTAAARARACAARGARAPRRLIARSNMGTDGDKVGAAGYLSEHPGLLLAVEVRCRAAGPPPCDLYAECTLPNRPP